MNFDTEKHRWLWVSDSIYNSQGLVQRTHDQFPNTQIRHDMATYGGNMSGGGLLELSDDVYAFIGGDWKPQERAVPLDSYTGMVFEFLRNDCTAPGMSSDLLSRIVDKILSQAAEHGIPYVVAGNCPPLALDDLSAWKDDPAQSYISDLGQAVGRHDVPLVDTYGKYLELVASKAYAVKDLMKNFAHPSGGAGEQVIAAMIGDALRKAKPLQKQEPIIKGKVVTYLFGKPWLGQWFYQLIMSSTQPYLTPISRIASCADQCLFTNRIGSHAMFPERKCSQIWFHYYADVGSTAVADIFVDGGTPNEVHVQVGTNASTGVSMYPRSALVADGLDPTKPHSVDVSLSTGTYLRILGITNVGCVD